MPRYIDAEKLDNQVKNKKPPYNMNSKAKEGFKTALLSVRSMIHSANNFDVQEVVRCKNCKFFDSYDKVEDFDGQCVVRNCETDKEEFCSYGRKQADEK